MSKSPGTITLLLTILSILVLIPCADPILAAIRFVPTEYDSLQHAVDACSPADTIIVEEGVYHQRCTVTKDRLVIGSRFLLNGDTSHIVATVLDGDSSYFLPNQRYTIITFSGGTDPRLEIVGLSFVNGNANAYGGQMQQGGAIYCLGNLTVRDCRFSNCRASGGGAIWFYAEADTLQVRGCIFNDNETDYSGGAVYSIGTLLADSCRFENCKTKNYGGALYIASYHEARFSNSFFIGNQAGSSGGAIYGGTSSSRIYVNDCAFVANSMTNPYGEGGGVFANIIEITDSDFRDCVSYYGAAIYASGLLATNCRFDGNHSDKSGILYVPEKSAKSLVSVASCTFVENTTRQREMLHLGGLDTLRFVANSLVRNGNRSDRNLILFIGREQYQSTYMDFRQNLIAFNTCDTVISYRTDVSHPWVSFPFYTTNIYGNSGGDWLGWFDAQYLFRNNQHRDPLICDTANNVLTLNSISPCLPENNEANLLIGAAGQGCSFSCGDVNGSSRIDIVDGVSIVHYFFDLGPVPKDISRGDLDCSGMANLGDAVFLLNFIFASGLPPCANCPGS